MEKFLSVLCEKHINPWKGKENESETLESVQPEKYVEMK